VRFYRKTRGRQAVDRPAVDLEAGFAAGAKVLGPPEFDPFADDMNFLIGGMLFEDVGASPALPLPGPKDHPTGHPQRRPWRA
jgi:hypothetical protein